MVQDASRSRSSEVFYEKKILLVKILLGIRTSNYIQLFFFANIVSGSLRHFQLNLRLRVIRERRILLAGDRRGDIFILTFTFGYFQFDKAFRAGFVSRLLVRAGELESRWKDAVVSAHTAGSAGRARVEICILRLIVHSGFLYSFFLTSLVIERQQSSVRKLFNIC